MSEETSSSALNCFSAFSKFALFRFVFDFLQHHFISIFQNEKFRRISRCLKSKRLFACDVVLWFGQHLLILGCWRCRCPHVRHTIFTVAPLFWSCVHITHVIVVNFLEGQICVICKSICYSDWSTPPSRATRWSQLFYDDYLDLAQCALCLRQACRLSIAERKHKKGRFW